jgi:ABC-type nitrate/sulfonate/bicarbonate transport system permease component
VAQRLLAIGLVAAILAAWEAASRLGLASRLFFPAPSVILATLFRALASGRIVPDLLATLGREAGGAALGCLPACALGLAMGASPRLRATLDPLVASLHPMPKIALLPLFMVVLGIGEISKLTAVAVAAFFPMLLNSMAGVRQINPLLFDVARSYGASRRRTFLRVVLPGGLPMVMVGLRLSLNVALLITIAAEMVAARRGLGTVIWLAWETMRTEDLYAGLLLIAVLGVLTNVLLRRLTARLVPWQLEFE